MEWRDKAMAFCTRSWRPERVTNGSRCQFAREEFIIGQKVKIR